MDPVKEKAVNLPKRTSRRYLQSNNEGQRRRRTNIALAMAFDYDTVMEGLRNDVMSGVSDKSKEAAKLLIAVDGTLCIAIITEKFSRARGKLFIRLHKILSFDGWRNYHEREFSVFCVALVYVVYLVEHLCKSTDIAVLLDETEEKISTSLFGYSASAYGQLLELGDLEKDLLIATVERVAIPLYRSLRKHEESNDRLHQVISDNLFEASGRKCTESLLKDVNSRFTRALLVMRNSIEKLCRLLSERSIKKKPRRKRRS